jgi:hypothetical protein
MDLASFLRRVDAAIRRNDGDMYVCQAAEYPLVKDWVQVMNLPVTVMNDIVLLRFHPPRFAYTAAGDRITLVSYHAGRYYGVSGHTYREKDLVWTM